MKSRGLIEYFLYENKKTGDVSLFMRQGDEFRYKRLKKNTHAQGVLNYALGVSQYVSGMILHTNIAYSSDEEEVIKRTPFVEYRKSFPDDFLIFIKEHDHQKSQPKSTVIEIDIFEEGGYSFLSTIIRTNEKKKRYLRLKSSVDDIQSEIFNYLKDTLRIFARHDAPVYVYTGIEGVKEYFIKRLKNKKVKERISDIVYREFDSVKFLEKQKKLINELIISHERDLKIKDEVSVDYESPASPNKIVVYTDASAYYDKSGYGVIIKQDGCEELMFKMMRKLKKSPMLFVSDISEGVAIYEALRFLAGEKIIKAGMEIEVRSDSLSNIRKLNRKEDAKHEYTEKTLILCEALFPDNQVLFRWVKGHSKSKYNVMADKMAEESLNNSHYELVVERNEGAILALKNRPGVKKNSLMCKKVDKF